MLRGLLHRLADGMGVLTGAAETVLAPEQRAALRRLGVRAGRLGVFMPALLKPPQAACRAALWAIAQGVPTPSLPPPARIAQPPPPEWPEGFAAAAGWFVAGPVLLRLDIAERVSGELFRAGRAVPIPPGIAARLGVRAPMLPAVLRALGFRLLPAPPLAADMFGPPTPVLLLPLRRRTAAPAQAAAPQEGPFAALAALRR
jgi:ATP-dependent RNA helicase SUPV3L1/SUV3